MTISAHRLNVIEGEVRAYLEEGDWTHDDGDRALAIYDDGALIAAFAYRFLERRIVVTGHATSRASGAGWLIAALAEADTLAQAEGAAGFVFGLPAHVPAKLLAAFDGPLGPLLKMVA